MPPGDLFDLTGRVALVTGASSGIGKSIALALASAGADVLLVARGADALDAACAEIERSGGRAASLPCDLADRMALKACAARASARFGAPDILVCAAGVNLRAGGRNRAGSHSDSIDRKTMFKKAYRSGLLFLLLLAGYSHAAGATFSSTHFRYTYDVAQLTRAQAQAWSRYGVNANAIAPGFFATALTAAVADDSARWAGMAARTFIGRNGELSDLWGAALFLASRASDYVTGQTLFVDGGFSAG